MTNILSQGRRRRRHSFNTKIKDELNALVKLADNWHGMAAISADIGIIASAIALGYLFPICYPLSAAVIGSRQRALATLLHEASHRTLCSSRRLNALIGMTAGWAIGQSYYRYHHSHVREHHPYLGDENRDPDIRNYIRQGLFSVDAHTFIQKNFVHLATGLLGCRNLCNLVRDRLVPRTWSELESKEKREYGLFLAFWMLLVTGVIYSGNSLSFAMFWLIPYLTTFQAVNWLIELAEHFPLTRLFYNELEMTRNRRGNMLENFFTGVHGENWHLTHHLRPDIPFWLISKAHAVMMQDPRYAAANERSGGLIVKGPNGEPSIISILATQLSAAQEMPRLHSLS